MTSSRPTSPPVNDDGFPQFLPPHIAGPPSIISSRMTDIASEDGEASKGATSPHQSDVQSRPETAKTGISSNRPTPLRRGLSGKRGSLANSVTGSSSMAPRPQSAASRSHVPSLTSHAFFHPMNAQKLQAQRGATRPSTRMRSHLPGGEDDATDTASNPRQSIISNTNPVAQLARQLSDHGEAHQPPSPGTEMTEPETVDRITANTSPTHGYYPTASVSESMRPLQRQKDGRKLTVEVDKGYKGTSLPTPVKTPLSFRSSFLIPGQDGSNREMQGGEKLDSVASSPQLGPLAVQESKTSPRPAQDQTQRSYNFQHFDGNMVFCLGGRLQNARHRPVNIATGLLVVIPCVLFLVFCAPWCWHNISPAVPIIFAYLAFISVSSFMHASTSDPGILPRNLHKFPEPDPNEDPLRTIPPTNDWTLVKSADKAVAAMEVPTKYCKTCNIWRPPRAHHCRLCDNCIETQDHHCVWVNNCIGRRNYRYFFTFLASTSLLAAFLVGAGLGQVLVHRNQENISFGDALSETKFRVAFALAIYGILGFMYPAALLGYHIFLMARGETTREYLNSHKFLKKDRYRAFTQGNWFRNWFTVLCRPRPPTYYRFKEQYVEGDQRLGPKREQRKADSKEGLEMQDVKHSDQQPTTGFQGPVSLRNSTPAQGA